MIKFISRNLIYLIDEEVKSTGIRKLNYSRLGRTNKNKTQESYNRTVGEEVKEYGLTINLGKNYKNEKQ